MARDKTDEIDTSPAATSATTATTATTIRATFPQRRAQGGPLTWKREIAAEDEISRETRTFAEIETFEQAMDPHFPSKALISLSRW